VRSKGAEIPPQDERRLAIFEELKQWVGFGSVDEEALRGLHAHVEPHFPRIAEAFYDRILANPTARRVLEQGEPGRQPQVTLVRWMGGLFRGPQDGAYFELRCRIGRVRPDRAAPALHVRGDERAAAGTAADRELRPGPRA
jgi:hypothetical protein